MKRILICLLCGFLALPLFAARSLKVVVEAGDFERQDCVVSVSVPGWDVDRKSGVVMFEKVGKKKKPVKCQVIWKDDKTPVLYWVLDGITPSGESREFVIQQKKGSAGTGTMKVEDTGKALVLKQNGSEILQLCNCFPACRSGFVLSA